MSTTAFAICATEPHDDLDIYCAAKLLIDKYGGEAHTVAKKRADVLKAAGDNDGYATFTRIIQGIRELGRVEPEPSKRRH